MCQLSASPVLTLLLVWRCVRRTDPGSHALSAEFLESVERIVRDSVEITEQSIRFTVVDPLVTRLERHDQLSAHLAAREQLARECRALREAVEQMKAAGKPEVDDKRRQSETKLAALQMELDGVQRELLPAIGALFSIGEPSGVLLSLTIRELLVVMMSKEDLTHGHGFTNQSDLFAAMVNNIVRGWSCVDGPLLVVFALLFVP